MRAMRVVNILGLVLGLLVGSAAAQSVQSDFDRSFQFSNLKTFSFAIQRRGATDPLAADSLNDGRIRTGLESQLIANGFRMETEKADFVIAYYVTTKNKLSVQDYGYGPPRWFGSRDIRVNQYSEGTLMVDFIDVKTNQVIWRGRASGTLEMKGVDKKISKSTEKLVKQFVKDTQKKG
ncbi:MAG TPA: DUF4136 domain-containing protein [Pyrinomonadaceae bacterium]|nr:DUF4136 domain-containing protein [Pyrinomonadaceae bacterium]